MNKFSRMHVGARSLLLFVLSMGIVIIGYTSYFRWFIPWIDPTGVTVGMSRDRIFMYGSAGLIIGALVLRRIVLRR